jgi:hypothetical protein
MKRKKMNWTKNLARLGENDAVVLFSGGQRSGCTHVSALGEQTARRYLEGRLFRGVVLVLLGAVVMGDTGRLLR